MHLRQYGASLSIYILREGIVCKMKYFSLMENIVYYFIWAWNFVLRSWRTGIEGVRKKGMKILLEVKCWTAETKREIIQGFPIYWMISNT